MLHIGRDIGGKERNTLVLIGAALMDVVFERSHGFGPTWAPNGLDKFLDMFNARMYNGQIMWKEQEHMLLPMKECEGTWHGTINKNHSRVPYFLLLHINVK